MYVRSVRLGRGLRRKVISSMQEILEILYSGSMIRDGFVWAGFSLSYDSLEKQIAN